MLVWACIGVGIWLALNVAFVVVRLWPDNSGALDSNKADGMSLTEHPDRKAHDQAC
jgi:hypothetical protein